MASKDKHEAYDAVLELISKKINIFYSELEVNDKDSDNLEFLSKLEALQELHSEVKILKKDSE